MTAYLDDIPPVRTRGTRPVIVVSNDAGNRYSMNVIVVQVTSRKKKPLPTHVLVGAEVGLKHDSIASCENLLTISKDKLIRYVGSVVGTKYDQEIDQAVKVSIGLDEKEDGKYGRCEGVAGSYAG